MTKTAAISNLEACYRAAERNLLVSAKRLHSALDVVPLRYIGDNYFSTGREIYKGVKVGAKKEIYWTEEKTKPGYFRLGIRHLRGGEYV